MKIKTLSFVIAAIFLTSCGQTETKQNTDQPKNISTNSNSNLNSNTNGNVLANLEREREELVNKSANVKKELDELQNKAKNANVKPESIHETIHEIETDVNAPKNK